MSLLAELDGLGDGFCYKQVAPNGAFQSAIVLIGFSTELLEVYVPTINKDLSGDERTLPFDFGQN